MTGQPIGSSALHPVFVLSHADFDTQNIIVTQDGHLAGLIDWDGVAIVPRVLGNERYPNWLTHDWNPFGYDYNEGEDQVRLHGHRIGNGCCPTTDSPEDLEFYRGIYQDTITALSKKIIRESEQNTAADSSDLKESVRRVCCVTRNSLLIGALQSACMSRFGCSEIVDLIWDRIEEAVDADSPTGSTKESDGEIVASDTAIGRLADTKPLPQDPREGFTFIPAERTSRGYTSENKAAVQGYLGHGESAEDTGTLFPNSSVRGIENLMQDELQKNAESSRLTPEAPKRSELTTVSDSAPSETTDEDNEVLLSGLQEEDHDNFTLYGMGIALGNDALDE